MEIVLTGYCYDATGNWIVRDKVIAAAQEAGYTVAKKVSASTTYLIASRDDTVKAQTAKKLGVRVISSALFVEMLRSDGVSLNG